MMFDGPGTIQGTTYGASLLHRLPAGIKLSLLAGVSIALFFWPSLWSLLGLLLALLLAILGLYRFAGVSVLMLLQHSKFLILLLGLLFLFSLWNMGWLVASIIVLRLACLFLLANLVTLTTPLSVMMACFECIFVILKPLKCDPAKAALVFSLTLRFVSVLNRCVTEVRQAQAARGLEWSLVATFVPVVVLMLKMSEDIANAIEARGFDGYLKENRGNL